MYDDLLYGFYSLPFKFSGKVLPLILILLFSSFILYMPTRLSSSSANKTFKSKNSVGRKRCQLTLKVLKVLLLHLFVTLLIKKATGSDNRHFFFKVLENEIKEEFLTYSTSCTPEQIQKKYIAEAIYPRMHYPKRNDILWELLPFHNWSFSTERMIISLNLYLQLAMAHGTYFKKETSTSFIWI